VRSSRVVLAVLFVVLPYGVMCLAAHAIDHMRVVAALGDTALLTRAQADYARSNGGFFEADLARVDATLPASPDIDPLSKRTLASEGRWFVPGPPVDPTVIAEKKLSPSSVRGFAYFADVASRRAWWTRLTPMAPPPAGFCGDDRGTVCELAALPPASAITGRCPADCKPIAL
jgi:hypothetical protein